MDTVLTWVLIAVFFGIVMAGALAPMAQSLDDYVPPPAQAGDDKEQA